MKLAASEEFISSAAALPAFQAAYGFKLSNSQLLSFSGGNTALTEQAASQGSNGVNFAMAYGTDGSLAALGLVVLADTKAVQPIYEPTPIVRKEVLDRYPAIASILGKLFKGLDLVTLQGLNARAAVNGESPGRGGGELSQGKGTAQVRGLGARKPRFESHRRSAAAAMRRPRSASRSRPSCPFSS